MFVRKRELYTPVVGPPNHLSIKKMVKVKKKLYLIRFTNFLITVHIIVGGKDARRRTVFCDIPFIKEQVSNQEKSTFYLNLK